MSKEVKNSITPEKLGELADAVIYTPNATAKKLKAKFWARYNPGLLGIPDVIPVSEIAEVTKDGRVDKLWLQPGFQDWFLNKDENRERLEYLFTLAMDAAEDMLTNPDIQPSARVNAIKVVAELANKFPSRYQQERFTDDEINKMSELQLKAWLEKRGALTVMKEVPATIGEYVNVEYATENQTAEEGQDTGKDLRSKLHPESGG